LLATISRNPSMLKKSMFRLLGSAGAITFRLRRACIGGCGTALSEAEVVRERLSDSRSAGHASRASWACCRSGEYTVRLKVDGVLTTKKLKVRLDPRVPARPLIFMRCSRRTAGRSRS